MGRVRSRIAEVAAKVPDKGYLFLGQCQNQLPFLHVANKADLLAGFAAQVEELESGAAGKTINICYAVKVASTMRTVVEWMMKKTAATPFPHGDHFKCEAMKMGVLQAIDVYQNENIGKFIGNSDVTHASRTAFLTVFTDADAQAAANLCLHCQLSLWMFEEGKFIIRRMNWKTDWKLQQERQVKMVRVDEDDKESLRMQCCRVHRAVLHRRARIVCLFLRRLASRRRIVSQRWKDRVKSTSAYIYTHFSRG